MKESFDIRLSLEEADQAKYTPDAELAGLFSDFIHGSDDPKEGSQLEGLLAANLNPATRYSLDESSWSIVDVERDPSRLGGRIHVNFTASLHLGCRDIGGSDDQEVTLDYSFDSSGLIMTIGVDIHERDSFEEF